MITNAFDELKWRELVFDYIEGVPELLARQKVILYNGFDATADSLHIGHLVPLLALARLQKFGHHPIALAGGGTSMIGDPAGKTSERKLLTLDEIASNIESIKKQLAQFLDFEVKTNPARILNNGDWLLPLRLVEFLRDTGKHFTVNYMVAKDSVKSRLEREDGISFTEFSYMLLQSYDFLQLFKQEKCIMQTGGSDQWGNITAGIKLIKSKQRRKAYGMVYPLVTKADGTKFGKTEKGSVWLSPDRTSPYHFYQFWLNTDDQDVITYLKFFTFLDEERIQGLAEATRSYANQRQAQHELAEDVTRLVHGEAGLQRAIKASKALFGGDFEGLAASEIEEIFAHVPSCEVVKSELEGEGISLLDICARSGLTSSKSDARRLVQGGGGLYLNNQRVTEVSQMVTLENAIEGRFVVVRKGRKDYLLVKIVS